MNYKIKVKWTEKEMGIISEKKIIIFNYLSILTDNIKKISFEERVLDFHFYENKEFPLIIITKNDIKYALNQYDIKTIYIINEQYKNNFYNQKLK